MSEKLASERAAQEAHYAKLGKARVRRIAEAIALVSTKSGDSWERYEDAARAALVADAEFQAEFQPKAVSIAWRGQADAEVASDSNTSANTGPSLAAAPAVITDEMVRRANGVDGAGIGLAVTRRMLEAAFAPEPTPIKMAEKAVFDILITVGQWSVEEKATLIVSRVIDICQVTPAASDPAPRRLTKEEFNRMFDAYTNRGDLDVAHGLAKALAAVWIEVEQ